MRPSGPELHLKEKPEKPSAEVGPQVRQPARCAVWARPGLPCSQSSLQLTEIPAEFIVLAPQLHQVLNGVKWVQN